MPRGKTTTKKCEFCKKDVSLFAYNRHINSHISPKRPLKNGLPFVTGNCKFCNKEFGSKNGLSNHECRCSANPNRKIQVMTDDGRRRISEVNKSRVWTKERREKLSESMKAAVDRNPESYTSANRGRTKQIIYDGLTFQGKWELDFYKWAKDTGLSPSRVVEGFKYTWNGDRTYFPDFYIEKYDLYVEVKGYETDRDRAKWDQFTKTLSVVKSSSIKELRNGLFTVDKLLALQYNN